MSYTSWKDCVCRGFYEDGVWEKEASRLNQKWLKEHFVSYADVRNLTDTKLLVGGKVYAVESVDYKQTPGDYPEVEVRATLNPRNCEAAKSTRYSDTKTVITPTITNVIFNPPATIVFWSDKTKTIVKHDPNLEAYDPEKGLAMAICKKLIGNNESKYYNTFKHWLKKCDYYTKEDPKNV